MQRYYKCASIVYKLVEVRKEFKSVPSQETKNKLRKKRKKK